MFVLFPALAIHPDLCCFQDKADVFNVAVELSGKAVPEERSIEIVDGDTPTSEKTQASSIPRIAFQFRIDPSPPFSFWIVFMRCSTTSLFCPRG